MSDASNSTSPTGPRFPHVHVELTGHEGNAFSALVMCLEAMKAAGISKADRQAFTDEALAGDYNHFLGVCMTWLDVC